MVDQEDPTVEQASQYLARLSEGERYALRRLSVLRWFDRPLYEFIHNAQPPLQFEKVIRLDGVNPLGRTQAPDQYTIAPVLREYLAASFRKESAEEFVTVHRLAASYFHRPLAEVDLTTLGYVIDELGYLSVANPDEATLRLAQFGHTALMAGWTEAASRAARAIEQSRSVAFGSAWSVPVARLVTALATIFSRANLDIGSITELSTAIAGMQEPQSDAENSLVSLANQAVDRFSLFGALDAARQERQELYTRTVRPIYAAAIACLALTVTTFVVWSFGVSQDTLKALLALSSTISVIITGLLTFIGLSVRQFSQRHVRQERFAEKETAQRESAEQAPAYRIEN